uniref:Uncharacterized protein LOC116944544 isoform X1 n=1 Tax=Petromyzon marinus TaxID=7757 RepID=A0AAJ7WXW6_PETMA|nr:uncharacterized protein LOC116944544 isoform X1 [Petromyzon marinus]
MHVRCRRTGASRQLTGQMAVVFEPPSRARLKFSTRRRKEGKSPLAFRCALLALARAAYPDLEGMGLDSLALDRLLALAAELGIMLSIPEEAQITSLTVAQNMQAHLALRRPAVVVACAGVPLLAALDAGVAAQGEGTLAAVAAFDRRGGGTADRRPERRWRAGPPRPQGTGQVTCFRCGQQGHFERGCNNAPGAFVRASPSATGSLTTGPSRPQVSCDASITRLLTSPPAPRGVRVHPQGVISRGSGSWVPRSVTSGGGPEGPFSGGPSRITWWLPLRGPRPLRDACRVWTCESSWIQVHLPPWFRRPFIGWCHATGRRWAVAFSATPLWVATLGHECAGPDHEVRHHPARVSGLATPQAEQSVEIGVPGYRYPPVSLQLFLEVRRVGGRLDGRVGGPGSLFTAPEFGALAGHCPGGCGVGARHPGSSGRRR